MQITAPEAVEATGAPGQPPGETPLTPDSPLADWGRKLILEQTGSLVDSVPAARLGEDIEGLHDLRVATRRLGASLRVFGEAFAGPEFDTLCRDARRVRRRSGALRDLDVLIEFLEADRQKLTGPDRLGMRYQLAVAYRWHTQRRADLLRTLEWLDGKDPVRVAKAATDHPPAAGNASPAALPLSFRQVAPRSLAERYQELHQYLSYVHQPEAETELHALRIAVKRLRYTMEIFAPCYVGRLKKPVGIARRLQDALGELHDSDYRRYLLRDLIARPRRKADLRRSAPATPADIDAGLPLLLAREDERRHEIYQEFARFWFELEGGNFPEWLLGRLQSPDAPPGAHPAPERSP